MVKETLVAQVTEKGEAELGVGITSTAISFTEQAITSMTFPVFPYPLNGWYSHRVWCR